MSLNTEALFTWLSNEGLDPEFVEEDTEIIVCCRLCEDDRPRLYISADTGANYCFHCGNQGSLLDLLKAFAEDFDEAFELKRKMWDEDAKVDPFAPVARTHTPIRPMVAVDLPPEYRPLAAGAPSHFVRYLEKRGVSMELAAARNIGFALEGQYRYRVILPVVNGADGQRGGQLFTFIARTIFVRCPVCGGRVSGGARAAQCLCSRPISKVLTPTGGRPRLALYNLDAVRAAGSGRLVVVEGPFDALRLPTEAVALLGSSPSATQISLLAGVARGRAVIVCLDGDDAGRMGAVKVADALTSAMIPVRVARLPEGKDPGSLSKEALAVILDSARRYIL